MLISSNKQAVTSRHITLLATGVVVQFYQFIEAFNPTSTKLSIRREFQKDVEFEAYHDITIGEIRDSYMGGQLSVCTIHLAPQLDVVLHPTQGKLVLIDHATHEQVVLTSRIFNLSKLTAEDIMELAEQNYLQNSHNFSDPYQLKDPRQTGVTFRRGSHANLQKTLNILFHAFSTIFEVVPTPSVIVFTEHDTADAGVDGRLFDGKKNWNFNVLFLALLMRAVQENTPVGFQFLSGNDGLARRSSFQQESIMLRYTIPPPTPDAIVKAQDIVVTMCREQGIILDPKTFQHTPLIPTSET